MNGQKVKKILTLSTIGFFLTACSHDKDCCTDIDTAISIKYPNEVGENLFDPDNGPSESHMAQWKGSCHQGPCRFGRRVIL